MREFLIGLSGKAGSFTEEASMLYVEKHNLNANLKYFLDSEKVLNALQAKQIDLGIIPFFNTQGGLVKMTLSALARYTFDFVDELWLEVNQCLIVKPNTRKDQITTIISHEQALLQCKEYLKRNFQNVELKPDINTAKSVCDLAENKHAKTTAVVGSARAAKIYGLEILASNIQDSHSNRTGFIILQSFSDGDK